MHKKSSSSASESSSSWKTYLVSLPLIGLIILLVSHMFDDHPHRPSKISEIGDPDRTLKSRKNNNPFGCPIASISELSPDDIHPQQGPRHMVTPPDGGPIHLICCQTTKGPLNAVVHERWAPNGAKRFLDMVRAKYFDASVPMMRCLKGFLCQFGLNSNPDLTKDYNSRLTDDPNWLPEGPKHRENDQGVVRFAHGYLAYAGGGQDSRTNQFIVSLKGVKTLAGGSPWEVPWGELVGKHSFDTLSQIYTGYGENGPSQGSLHREGVTAKTRQDFPNLDYITGCSIVDTDHIAAIHDIEQ